MGHGSERERRPKRWCGSSNVVWENSSGLHHRSIPQDSKEYGWCGERQDIFDAMGSRPCGDCTRRRTGSRAFAISRDSQLEGTMRRLLSDKPRPVQDMAVESIELAELLYEQYDSVTIRWVLGHKGVMTSNEVADSFARNAALSRSYGGEKQKTPRSGSARLSSMVPPRRRFLGGESGRTKDAADC